MAPEGGGGVFTGGAFWTFGRGSTTARVFGIGVGIVAGGVGTFAIVAGGRAGVLSTCLVSGMSAGRCGRDWSIAFGPGTGVAFGPVYSVFGPGAGVGFGPE